MQDFLRTNKKINYEFINKNVMYDKMGNILLKLSIIKCLLIFFSTKQLI